MSPNLEGVPAAVPSQRQAPLALRYEHRPYWPEIRSRLGGTETLAAVALALAHAVGWCSYSRTARHYDVPQRYRHPLYSWRRIVGAIDRLDALGLIEHDRRPPGQRGWQSAAKATPELCALINRITHGTALGLARPRETIVLRDGQKKLLDYRDTAETHRMRRNLGWINEGLGSVALLPAISAPLLRIFNAHHRRGGRFYAMGGAWQGLSKEARARVQIDGEPVVELDFRSLHPALLYAEAGLPTPADPYELPPWPRPLVKLALLVMINARTRQAALRAIACHETMARVATPGTPRAREVARRLSDEVERAHRPIAHAFGSDAGARLMRLDSDIAEVVMLEMLSRGIVVLPVHDSFIAPASKRADLETAMIEAAERLAGAKLTVA